MVSRKVDQAFDRYFYKVPSEQPPSNRPKAVYSSLIVSCLPKRSSISCIGPECPNLTFPELNYRKPIAAPLPLIDQTSRMMGIVQAHATYEIAECRKTGKAARKAIKRGSNEAAHAWNRWSSSFPPGRTLRNVLHSRARRRPYTG